MDDDPEADLPRMTLPEHLDELRARLIRSIVAIVAAMIVSFFFAKDLMDFVTAPYYEAAALAGLSKATRRPSTSNTCTVTSPVCGSA